MRYMIFIFIPVLFFGCKQAIAGNPYKYEPFVDSNKVWYVSENPDAYPATVWPHKIFLGNDTTINSKIYKKVIDCRGDSIENNCSQHLLGYIRETDDRKVYWCERFFGRTPADILLYDFNAKINDTIDNWIVSKIDTVKIQNIERKRITLRNCTTYSKTWIEGIGNMADLLGHAGRSDCDPKTGIVALRTGGSLFRQTCVMQGTDFIYKYNEDSECWKYKGHKR